MYSTPIDCYDVWVNIIIPLLSALIGGFITMLGVLLTIKRDQRKEYEYTLKTAKPWIFSLDSFEQYDCKYKRGIQMRGKNPIGDNCDMLFIIRNTDNAIGIIEKFKTENNVYYPASDNILDKDSVTKVTIYFDTNETLNNMHFIIRDVYGHRYKYKAYQPHNSARGNQIKEIGLIKDKPK